MRYLVTSTYTLTGNTITDIIEAESLDEAYIVSDGLRNRQVEDIKPTDWNGLMEFPGNNARGKARINIHQYNPD